LGEKNVCSSFGLVIWFTMNEETLQRWVNFQNRTVFLN
jgi:hypothetical protein